MKRYVGYSEFYHDAALAIVNPDGEVAFASQSERYSGIKMDGHIHPPMWEMVNDDDHVTFYEDLNERMTVMGGLRTFGGATSFEELVARDLKDGDENLTRAHTSEIRKPIHNQASYDSFNKHHESHAALGFFTRPWESKEDTVIVSVDGSGEVESTVIYDHNFKPLKVVRWPQSLGTLYGMGCVSIKLKPLRDEYILMGLAAYGEPQDDLYQILHDCYYWHDTLEGQAVWDMIDFKGECIADSELAHRDYQFELQFRKLVKSKYTKKESDVAATVQKFFETEILKIMTEARQYGSKLIFTGGCAQNVVANSLIRPMFDEMHIPIAPNDAGNALGCAAYTWHKETGGTHLKWSPYLGHNIEREIDPKEVAQHIVDNKVCGVANGRAEYGPRALGNRSLLADVRFDVKDTVNDIKLRHKYRPFAPAILSEWAEYYFEGHMGEYMQYTATAKHPYDSVSHVDGTARVQLVKPDCESVLRQILEEYYKLTGVPMLLNTSLNIRNKPMVNTVEDAIAWEEKYKVKVF